MSEEEESSESGNKQITDPDDLQHHVEQQDDAQSRYPQRQRNVPVRYGIDEYVDTVLAVQSEEPQNLSEALESELSVQWREAADSEYRSLMQNDTWELVGLPAGRKPIRL